MDCHDKSGSRKSKQAVTVIVQVTEDKRLDGRSGYGAKCMSPLVYAPLTYCYELIYFPFQKRTFVPVQFMLYLFCRSLIFVFAHSAKTGIHCNMGVRPERFCPLTLAQLKIFIHKSLEYLLVLIFFQLRFSSSSNAFCQLCNAFHVSGRRTHSILSGQVSLNDLKCGEIFNSLARGFGEHVISSCGLDPYWEGEILSTKNIIEYIQVFLKSCKKYCSQEESFIVPS